MSLSTTISGAQFRYTTDGRLPTAQSPLYAGTPLRFTRTTQLRAQAFVGQTASGAPGTAMYVAQNVATAHDLPVVVLDSYGAGKPAREYLDATAMIFEPGAVAPPRWPRPRRSPPAPVSACADSRRRRSRRPRTASSCGATTTPTPTIRCWACPPTPTGCCAGRSPTRR